jgi:hypothetical protein
MNCSTFFIFQCSSGLLLQLLSLTGKYLEKPEKLRPVRMSSDILMARQGMLKVLFNLIKAKLSSNIAKQSKTQNQTKVDDFFNIQDIPLRPVVRHSELCRHRKRDRNT